MMWTAVITQPSQGRKDSKVFFLKVNWTGRKAGSELRNSISPFQRCRISTAVLARVSVIKQSLEKQNVLDNAAVHSRRDRCRNQFSD